MRATACLLAELKCIVEDAASDPKAQNSAELNELKASDVLCTKIFYNSCTSNLNSYAWYRNRIEISFVGIVWKL